MNPKISPSGSITPGRYQHYKGAFYYVYGTVRHSETEELLVLYRTDYQREGTEESHWVRPFSMFTESVIAKGKEQPRFALVTV